MTWSNSHTLLKFTHTKIATSAILVTSTLLLIFLGVTTIMSGSNQILHTIAFSQVEDREELREERRTTLVEDELQTGKNQNQSNASSPNEIALKIDRSHYIPLSPLSDSPGNQVKMSARLFCTKFICTSRRQSKRSNGSICCKSNIVKNFISS